MDRVGILLRRVVAARTGRVALAGAFVIAVTFLTAAVLTAIRQVDSFSDGLWWAMRHLIDPGSLGDDTTWTKRLIGLALTLSGIVLLIGVILEVLTQAVSRSLEALQDAPLPARASRHIVFVGWSERLPGIVATLARATELPDTTPWSRRVVLLANPEAGTRESLMAQLGPRRGPLKIDVVRAPADVAGYDMASCRTAKAVMILRDDNHLDDPAVQDLDSMRRAILLARYLKAKEGTSDPAVVFEVTRAGNIDAAAKLVPEHFDALVADRAISAMLRDALFEPAWAAVMARMLDPGMQPSLELLHDASLTGLPFGELPSRLEGATVLGFIKVAASESVIVAPPLQTMIAPGDSVVVLAGPEPMRIGPPRTIVAADLGHARTHVADPYRLLILGWNSRVPVYLEEVANTRGTRFEVTSVSSIAEAERVGATEAAHRKATSFECVVGDPLRREDVAAALTTTRPNAVIVTSTPVWGSAAPLQILRAADADCMVTLMIVCELADKNVRPIVADLFDPATAEAFKPALDVTTLPGDRISASIATWMAIESKATRAVSGLFADPGVIRTAYAFDPPDRNAQPFAAVHRALLDRGCAAIGFLRNGAPILNPAPEELVNPGERLLVFERDPGGAKEG